jgi:hypothetical protein
VAAMAIPIKTDLISREVTASPADEALNEKGPSSFEPGPSSHLWPIYFSTFAFLAPAVDP